MYAGFNRVTSTEESSSSIMRMSEPITVAATTISFKVVSWAVIKPRPATTSAGVDPPIADTVKRIPRSEATFAGVLVLSVLISEFDAPDIVAAESVVVADPVPATISHVV